MSVEPVRISAIAAHARGSVLSLAVVPRSSANAVELSADGIVRVRVTAPPVDGAANAALLRLLADALGVPRSRLSIACGESSRRKRVLVTGFVPDALDQRLQAVLSRRWP